MWRENTRKKIPTSTCSKTVFSDIKIFFCLSEKMQKEMIFQRSENNDVETKNAISNVLIKIHDKKSYLNLLQLQERNLAQIILLVPGQK